MKIAVNFRVNVANLDKARFYKGAKGVYADMTAFIDIDEVGQYGDNGTISQQTSKEERDQGMKMPIIGNTTVFWRNDDQPVAKKVEEVAAPVQQAPPQIPPVDDMNDDIPF